MKTRTEIFDTTFENVNVTIEERDGVLGSHSSRKETNKPKTASAISTGRASKKNEEP